MLRFMNAVISNFWELLNQFIVLWIWKQKMLQLRVFILSGYNLQSISNMAMMINIWFYWKCIFNEQSQKCAYEKVYIS